MSRQYLLQHVPENASRLIRQALEKPGAGQSHQPRLRTVSKHIMAVIWRRSMPAKQRAGFDLPILHVLHNMAFLFDACLSARAAQTAKRRGHLQFIAPHALNSPKGSAL